MSLYALREIWWERSFILLMSHTHGNGELYVKNSSAALTGLGHPSLWLKGRNWNAQELRRQNKGWFTFSVVRYRVSNRASLSGAWEVFSPGTYPMLWFWRQLKNSDFLPYSGRRRLVKRDRRVSLLGPYPQGVSRPIRFAETARNWKSILLELATSRHLFIKSSWTSTHILACKTTALVDLFGPFSFYNSTMPCRLSYCWL